MRARLRPAEVELVQFLRDEAEVAAVVLSDNYSALAGFEDREEKLLAARDYAPDATVYNALIEENQLYKARCIREIEQQTPILQSHTSTISRLIEGKTDPRDVIDGAASEISRYNLFLGS